jgi:hypothetical protein
VEDHFPIERKTMLLRSVIVGTTTALIFVAVASGALLKGEIRYTQL